MTVIWGGSYRSRSASGSHPARVTAAAGIRRLAAALDGVALPPKARAVELSEWRGALDALAALPQIAPGAGGVASNAPGALNVGSSSFATPSLLLSSGDDPMPSDGKAER